MHILRKTAISLTIAGSLLISAASYSQVAKLENPRSTVIRLDADGLGMISGTVTDAVGKPVRRVAIGLQFQTRRPNAPHNNAETLASDDKPKASPPPATRPAAIQTTITDANGRFKFENVKPGSYTVIARDRQRGNIRGQVVLGESQEATIDLKFRQRQDQNPNQDNPNNNQDGNNNRRRNQN